VFSRERSKHNSLEEKRLKPVKELAKTYNPKQVEDRIYKLWESKDLFAAKPDPKKKPYCIVIPPPNITGILHMGHALNNTIQDILIRFKRMQGYESMWMPGTDHAGIATQNVVERELSEQGLDRESLGREKFLEKVWKWRDEYGSTIIHQLKKLGCSCDWARERFTMDEGLSDAVLEVFIRLHKKGLIYRGNYIINWCPRCQTALSDEEAEHRDIDGMLYYIKYPLKTQTANRKPQTADYLVVATTRPETMLGDVGVCVNPRDKRYKALIGKTVILPVVNREIPVVADKQVDIKFGTGVLKITPAHDPIDFELGLKHKLEPLNVMNPDATMNKEAGEFAGMDRFECRDALVDYLKEKGLFIKSEVHKHAVGHCYRCHTMVEPRLSKQWFVKMKPLAKPGIEAVKKGKIKFIPKRWTKVYLNWMENIRDWCISRQIWWGHRIPVYYCKECETGTRKSNIKYQKSKIENIIVSKTKPEKCPKCGSTDIEQDPDVLDTWFSSWLWPFSTFGWPKESEDFKYFYPTDTLVTAQEIIFFWVARMIMAGLEFPGEIPFRNVYIHGTVRDDAGTKMSKSLGNIIDPLEIIESFGADALRFSMILITATGQDVFLSPKKFEIGRNFANKTWNASRYILTTLKKDIKVDLCVYAKDKDLKLVDKWILSRFYSALAGVTKSLEQHRLNEAASRLYEFFWHEFCDWYIEFSKLSTDEETTQVILYKILEKSLRALHPFIPFITEELWQNLPHERDPIMVSTWPHMQKQFISPALEEDMAGIIEVITAVRNIRSEWNIDAKRDINAVLSCEKPKHGGLLKEFEVYIKRLCRLKSLEIGKGFEKPPHSAYAAPRMAEVYIPLEGIIDFKKERVRLIKKKGEITRMLELAENRLHDKNFLKKAPKEVIEKNKLSKTEFKSTLNRLEESLKDIEV
jgi:valyl-tRNA synthetase